MNKYIFLLLFVLCSSVLCAQKQELDEFNFRMFNEMCADKPNENIIYSPVSMNLTMGMILNGADEESQNEIKDAMGLGKYSVEELNECLKKSLVGVTYTVGNNYFSIEAPNAVWLQKGYDYKKSYVNTLKEYYNTQLFNVDFSSPEGVDSINKWTEEQSQGMLPKIHEKSLSNTQLDIESNLLFKDRLYYVNDRGNVAGTFNNADGSKVNVNIMNVINNYHRPSYSIGGFLITSLYFDSYQSSGGIAGPGSWSPSRFETYSLVICFPDNADEQNELLPLFAKDEDSIYLYDDYKKCICHFGDKNVIVPELALNARLNLDSCFKKITGIDLLSNIKLSGISNNQNIKLSSLCQNIHFCLDGQGSNSSGQTSTHSRKRKVQFGTLDLCINRPFKFIIVNQKSRDILFMGSINKLEGEDITDVNSVSDDEKRDVNIYDIYGRKCSSASKPGLYIKNGKKKIVKKY